MNIVYCINSMGVGGGVERVVTIKVNYLVGQGHHVTILTTDYEGRVPMYGLDPRVEIVDFGLGYAKDFRYSLPRRLFNTLGKMLRHQKLMKHYLMQHPTDIVVTTHAYETAFLPFLHDGSKKILEYHNSKFMYQMERNPQPWSLKALLVKLYEWRDAWIARRFDASVALTQEDYIERGKPHNMHVIPNPLPFSLPEDGISKTREHIVLAVGRLTPQKDFSALIDIWAMIIPSHPGWRLQIVGDGYLMDSLKSQVSSLGLEHSVELVGDVRNVLPYYEQASVYALSSTFEGFGMVLIEAMTCGVPVVSFDCPFGPSTIVTDGVDGYLVPVGNKDLFAQRLATLMDSESLRVAMGSAARESAQKYSTPVVMTHWGDLFRKSIDGGGDS